MTCIPSLTLQQLALLRMAKKHPDQTIHLCYEFPVIPIHKLSHEHPPFLQELIDAHLIQVQVKGNVLKTSEFQQHTWSIYCDDIVYPSQQDWELWRKVFIAQAPASISPYLAPGIQFEQFSKVWKREIGLQAIQSRKL